MNVYCDYKLNCTVIIKALVEAEVIGLIFFPLVSTINEIYQIGLQRMHFLLFTQAERRSEGEDSD